MKPSKTRFSILFAFIVLAVPSQLLAQSETGTITGTIADASGAVVPAVAVSAHEPGAHRGPEGHGHKRARHLQVHRPPRAPTT